MGSRWHEAACSRPHVVVDRDTKNILCQSCGTSPCLDGLVGSLAGANPAPSIPPDEKLGSLGLFWPNSVPYTRSSKDTSPAVGKEDARKNEKGKDAAVAHRKSNPPIYEYSLRPDEIRLLHLTSPLKDDSDSPIHANLNTYSDDEYPDYEAVSYTWGGEEGDSSPCRPIFIGPYWDVLLQTKNCWAMLKLIRPTNGQRVVWVDAICIDQSNFTEREDQIAKMCQIYENSMRAFVFLGEDIVHPKGNASYPKRRKLHELPREPLDGGESSPGNPLACDLHSLLKRRYFSRIWVVQEIILSRRSIIRIGSAEYWVDHQTIRDIANDNPNWDWGRTAAPWFQHATQSWLTAEDQIGLLGLMKLTWTCQATDPRDKLFGILGLDQWAPPIRPDYSISLQHAFIGMFAHCLINLKDTRVLIMASGIHGGDDYPSWIPAWKSIAGLPEPTNLKSDIYKRWSLDWKREFVRQINQSDTQSNTEDKDEYLLQDDFDNLVSHRNYSMVQFLPVIGGLERSKQQQWQSGVDQGDEQHNDTVLGSRSIVESSDQPPWHTSASVEADTACLLIPLIHLHCIKYKATLASQMGEYRCYRISSYSSGDDSESDGSITSEYGNSTTEEPEMLDSLESHMFFTTQAADLDDLIIPGQDHFFILDNNPSPPVLLILREIATGLFSLVASCEEVLFTYMTITVRDLTSGIKLQDICRTWDMPKVFHDIAHGCRPEADYNIMGEIRQLCHAFLGEPNFEDLCDIVQAFEDGNTLDVYMKLMSQYHPEYKCIDTCDIEDEFEEIVQMRLDRKALSDKKHLITTSEADKKWLPSMYSNVISEWWCDEDGTWKEFCEGWPGKSIKEVCIRVRSEDLLWRIETSLRNLKFLNRPGLYGIQDPGMDTSPQVSATEWTQPRTIPSLPGSLEEIGREFEFDGNCYPIRII